MPVSLIETLQDRLGPHGVLLGADAGGRYASDASLVNAQAPVAVLRPASTEEVAFILRTCHAVGQPLVI